MKSRAIYWTNDKIKLLFKLPAFSLVFLLLFSPIAPVFAREIAPTSVPISAPAVSDDSSSDIPSAVLSDSDLKEVKVDPLPEPVPLPPAPPEPEPVPVPEEEKPVEEEAINEDTNIVNPETTKTKLTPGIDNLTGALTYEYKIDVPSGRNDMTPDISLAYNSATATNDSIIGAGWSFNIPYIQRINKKGTDKLYTDNYFLSSTDGELIDQGGGVFTPRIENGAFNKYVYASDVWTITDKKGTRYVYGGTMQSRQDNPNDNSKIFSWMLEEVTDMNGNTIFYEYYKNEGQIYPDNISYNQSGLFEVTFNRTARSPEVQSYAPTFKVVTAYAINNITVEIDGDVSAEYDITTTNNRLDEITLTGYDESAQSLALPSTNLNYSSESTTVGYSRDGSIDLPYYMSGSDKIAVEASGGNTHAFTDINGDGLDDFIRSNSSAYNTAANGGALKDQYGVWINDGDGTGYTRDAAFGLPYYMSGSDKIALEVSGSGKALVDANGDGLTDVVSSYSGAYNTAANGGAVKDGWGVWLNTGSGFIKDTSFDLPYYLSGSDKIALGFGGVDKALADINGDGFTDVVSSYSGAYNTAANGGAVKDPFGVWLNNGSDYVKNTSMDLPYYLFGNDKIALEVAGSAKALIDVNGDGLTDLISSYGTAYNTAANGGALKDNYGIWLNTGSGFSRDATIDLPYYMSGSDKIAVEASGGNTHIFLDVNGDGLSDFMKSNGSAYNTAANGGALKDQYGIWVNTGNGFSRNASLDLPYYMSGSDKIALELGGNAKGFSDVDGDGLTDVVSSYGDAYNTAANGGALKIQYGMWVNTGNGFSQISEIENSIGGTTSIEYVNPSIQDSSNVAPIKISAVSSLVMNDNNGNSDITLYEYRGADYYYNNPFDKRFTGFGQVIEADEDGNLTTTKYHQANGENGNEPTDSYSKIGKAYEKTIENNSNDLFLLTRKNYVEDNIGGYSNSVLIESELTMQYDGTGSHLDSAVGYQYDSFGNLTQKTDWGEVVGTSEGSFTDTGTDKATENISYATNTANYVVGLSSQDTVLDQNGAKVREAKIYYDSLALGQVDKGNQTKVESWKSGSAYVNYQKAYNTYGLVTDETDANGDTTHFVYDSYNLYPASVTNPLNQTTNFTYDYSSGQITEKTDSNNFVYQVVYDGLDRVLQEKVPDLNSPYAPVVKTGYVYTDTPGAASVQKTDYLDDANSVDTYQYFDGLGRKIQERKEAESGYSVKDSTYNSRGLLEKESLPYNSSGFTRTASTATASLYTTYTYDPMNRVLAEINAVGATTYAYDDWKTTITDARGKIKSYYKDAYDNLIKVEEINSGSTYITNYEWNLNKNLTKITDALGNVRNFTYDGLGRKITAEDLHAVGDATYGVWNYVYDNAGNMTQSLDPNNQTINYTYDNLNRPLSEDYTGEAGTEVIYTYDTALNGIGKLGSVSASGANTDYSYNSLGGISSEIKNINSIYYQTDHAYDRQGNILEITNPDNSKIKYTYNGGGKIETIQRKEPADGGYVDVVANFDYSPTEQPTTITYANGDTTTNTYDANKLYRLSSKITTGSGGTHLQDLAYTYDAVGNITKIVDASNTDTAKTVDYVYDDLNRLTSVTASAVASGQSTYTQTYSYNAIGDILTGPLGTYLYQGSTGTNYANPHAATSINGVTNTYDKNGNLLSDGILTNAWDYNSRLTETVKGGNISHYYYDHSGNRVRSENNGNNTYYVNKYYSVDSTGKKTKNIYAGDTLVSAVESINTTIYRPPCGNKHNTKSATIESLAPPSPTKVKKITSSSETELIGPVTACRTTTTSVSVPYYNHTDHLNSVNVVTDSNSTQVELLDYYPFGAQRISSGSRTAQRQYIGQIYDVDTGLNYLNARYYDGNRGQFISQDSMFWQLPEELLIDPQQQNSYSYARNNPINRSDPDGKLSTPVIDMIKSFWNSWFKKPTPQLQQAAVPTVAPIITPQLPTQSISKKGTNDYPGGNYLTSNKVNITFDSGANNMVNSDLANYFGKIMEQGPANGINSLNISSTTNHGWTKTTPHIVEHGARALDINYINGIHVSPTDQYSSVLQNIIKNTPGYLENYGPSIINKIIDGKAQEAPWARSPSTATDSHLRHIHVSVDN